MKYDAIPRYPAVFRLSISQTDNKVTPRVQDDVNPSSILPGWCDYWKKAWEKEVKFRLEQNIFLWRKIANSIVIILFPPPPPPSSREESVQDVHVEGKCVCGCVHVATHLSRAWKEKKGKKKEKRGDTIGKSTYRDVSFILCNARRAAEGETKTGSSGSIMRTDTSRSLSLSLCLSLSRSRSFSRSLVSLIPDSLSSCLSLCSFSVLLSRTLSRSRSRFLSHAVSTTGGKGGDTGNKNSCNIN